MKFDIGDKAYDLKFSFGFIKEMDKAYKVEQNGLEMGIGVSMGYNALNMYSVNDLAKIIYLSAVGSPSLKQVENALEANAKEHGELSKLFDEVKNELKNSPMTKATIKNFLRNMEENA